VEEKGMRIKWLLGAIVALGASGYAMAQDSSENKQPPPTPAPTDNQQPPNHDNKTPPPAPANDQKNDTQNQTPARSDTQSSPSNNQTPPTPSDGQRTDIHANGQVNAQTGQNQTQTDRVGVQAQGQFQTGQQVQSGQQFQTGQQTQTGQRTQFNQQGVAVGGQVQQDRWAWPGQVQGQAQGGWVQNSQGQWVQNPGQAQGWTQPGYSQGGYVQGQYQPNQGGYVQGGQVYGNQYQGQNPGQPMDQSASMNHAGNFHRAKQVIGARVSIEGGLAVGTVEDIVFSDQGQIEFVVVANEGKLVSVPWAAAKFNFEQRQATVAINQEQFRQIPTFTASNYPSFADPQYQVQTYSYYNVPVPQGRWIGTPSGNWNGNWNGNWSPPRMERRGRR